MLNITAVAKKRVVTTPPPRLQYGADEFIGWFYEVADSGFTESERIARVAEPDVMATNNLPAASSLCCSAGPAVHRGLIREAQARADQ
jgi:hypothetical protein